MKSNVEICRAFGIDPTNVVKVVITLEGSQIPRVEVTRIVLPKDAAAVADRIQTVVEVLRLVPQVEPEAIAATKITDPL